MKKELEMIDSINLDSTRLRTSQSYGKKRNEFRRTKFSNELGKLRGKPFEKF